MKQLISSSLFYLVISTFKITHSSNYYTSEGSDVVKEGNATVTPLNYTITIKPVLDDEPGGLKAGTARFTLHVRVKGMECSNEIQMDHNNLRINLTDVKIFSVNSGESLPISNQTDFKQAPKQNSYGYAGYGEQTAGSNLYTIQLEHEFHVGEEMEITIPYELNLAEPHPKWTNRVLPPSAFAFESYPQDGGNETKFAITTYEKLEMKKVFPNFVNTVYSKNKYKIIIGRVDGKYISLSNMELDFTEAE